MVEMIILILACGALGGLLNALMTDNGFLLPKKEEASGSEILRPGCAGNVLAGALAALVSWGLYGPLAAYQIFHVGSGASTAQPGGGLTLSALAGAVLVGVGGSRWLSNEADKKLLRATTAELAVHGPKPAEAANLAMATPAEALQFAKKLRSK